MTDLILDSVEAALVSGGISAFRSFPARHKRLSAETCVVISLRWAKSLGGAMGDYLGLKEKENGGIVELYGKRLEIELLFEIYAPFEGASGAEDCVRCADELRALSAGLPSGIRPLEFTCGEVSAVEEISYFKCDCTLLCTAFLIAEDGGEQGEFLDFVLKGAVDHVN